MIEIIAALTIGAAATLSTGTDHIIAYRIAYTKSAMVQRGIPEETAQTIFKDPRIENFPPLPEGGPGWRKSFPSILSEESLSRGEAFYELHRPYLESSRRLFNVPEEIHIAVIRMETNFGKRMGSHNPLAVFFRKLRDPNFSDWRFASANMVAALLQCETLELGADDCLELKCSHEGACGFLQIIPTTLELYGHDGNGRALMNPFRIDHSIYTIGNMLKGKGWRNDSRYAKIKALGHYVGLRKKGIQRVFSSRYNYPGAVLAYAAELRERIKPPRQR